MIIAVDGPAASGKGTLAKSLAAHFGLNHLDTGLLYRAVARALIDQSLPLSDEVAAARMAQSLNFAALDEAKLRGREAGEAASVISVYPDVRQALLEGQRRFAAKLPGAVLDGRDIGTVVFPQADVKIYLDASPEGSTTTAPTRTSGSTGSSCLASPRRRWPSREPTIRRPRRPGWARRGAGEDLLLPPDAVPVPAGDLGSCPRRPSWRRP